MNKVSLRTINFFLDYTIQVRKPSGRTPGGRVGGVLEKGFEYFRDREFFSGGGLGYFSIGGLTWRIHCFFFLSFFSPMYIICT